MDSDNIIKLANLIHCRETYRERGIKIVTITHDDGKVSGIGNEKLFAAVKNTILEELDRQIAEISPLAEKDASTRTTVYHLHCPTVPGRSEYTYKASDLYGMTESAVRKMVLENRNRFRIEDCSGWIVEDQNGDEVN